MSAEAAAAEMSQPQAAEAPGDAGPPAAPASPGPAAPPAPPAVSDEAIRARLGELLAAADLDTMTEKKMRKQLEQDLGVDLSARKALVRSEIDAWLSQNAPQNGEEGEGEECEEEELEEEETRSKPKRKRGNALGSILSPELSAFVGAPTMSRPQVVKAIWEYIKANNLQDPKNKRRIICDDKMKTIFTPPIDMFSMNKQLSKHCKTCDAAGPSAASASDDESDDGEPRPKKKAAKKSKGEGTGKGGGNAFTKAYQLSEQLSQFVGQPSMSRPDLTKFFWAYIKENNLQNPSDRRVVLCNDELKALFKVKSFQGFGLQKLLGPHILSG